MQTTSAQYQNIVLNHHWFETRLIVENVGIVPEKEIFGISTQLDMFSNSPAVGSAVAGEISVTILKPVDDIPQMAQIQPQVRACGTAERSSTVSVVDERLIPQSASYANENVTINTAVSVSGENIIFPTDSTEYIESEWIPQGVFYIDTREVTANNDGLNILTIHGFDAMLKAEQDYSGTAVGGDYDTAYVRSIAAAIGVEVDDRTWDIMQTGYIIPFPLGYSMRETLGFIAASYAGCFIITDEGKLRLISLPDLAAETNLLIDAGGDYITFGYDHPETENTYTGSVVSFDNGGSTEITDVAVDIEPVQDLHGYDAPWPPGGGKNIANFIDGYGLNANGENVAYRERTSTLDPIIIEQGTSYIYTSESGNAAIYAVWSGDTLIRRLAGVASGTTLNVSGGDRFYVTAYGAKGVVVTVSNSKPMIRKSTSPSGYAPYSNECPISGWDAVSIWNKPTHDTSTDPTVTIQLGDTVYGGWLDATTGKMMADRAMVDLGTLAWSKTSTNVGANRRFATSGITSSVSPPASDSVVFNCKSSQYKAISTNGSWYERSDGIACSKGGTVYINDSTKIELSAASFKTAMSGVQLVYKLATPIEIQLDPVQIATLEDINTLWADAGDVSVTAVTAGGETVRILV